MSVSGYVPVTADAHRGQTSQIPWSWSQILVSQPTYGLSVEPQLCSSRPWSKCLIHSAISPALVDTILSISTVFRELSSRL